LELIRLQVKSLDKNSGEAELWLLPKHWIFIK
jgi:hypothetical protein